MKSSCSYDRNGNRCNFQIDGKEVSEAEFDAAHQTHDVSESTSYVPAPWRWPRLSESAGCHPKQVKTMQDAYAKLGVQTEFTSDGRAVFRSKEHEKAHLKASGRYNDAYL